MISTITYFMVDVQAHRCHPFSIYAFMHKLILIHFSHSSRYIQWTLGYRLINYDLSMHKLLAIYVLFYKCLFQILKYFHKKIIDGIPPKNSKILAQPLTKCKLSMYKLRVIYASIIFHIFFLIIVYFKFVTTTIKSM